MKMQMIQFESIVNLIQAKLMKVIDKMRNMMIQEFQHFGEFQLIEVMMPLIQFDSIVDLEVEDRATLHGNSPVSMNASML
jgi:hypothetical protein